jgi:two-component system, cell cycle response regulator DivK
MRKRRVLVVEDDPLSRELLGEWLDMEGYQVITAANLTTAKAAAQSGEPEIVLLDVKLGSEDGLQLALWMRDQSQLREIPIVAVTAHAMIAERDRILDSGCNGLVSKPVDFKLLQDHLDRWLGAQRDR